MTDVPAPDGDAVAESVAPEDTLDNEIPRGADTFDRKYVEELRQEARKYRERAKTAEAAASKYDVFEQFPEQDQQIWTEMAGKWLQDPKQSAEIMQTIASNVLVDPNATPEEKMEAAQDAVEVAEAQADPTITQEQVDKLVEEKLAARDQQQKQAQSVEAIHKQIEDAGYEKGTLEMFSVLWIANNDPSVEGNLDKAIEKFRDREKGTIDKYLQQKTGTIPPVAMPSSGAGGVETNQAPTRGHEMEEARKAADAWLESRRQA